MTISIILSGCTITPKSEFTSDEISEMNKVDATLSELQAEMQYYDNINDRAEYAMQVLERMKEDKLIKNINLSDDKQMCAFEYYTSGIYGGTQIIGFNEMVDSDGFITQVTDPIMMVN